MTLDRRIRRQTDTVARLSRELRFELLMLDRMRRRARAGLPAVAQEEDVSRLKGVSDVYAKAVLRQATSDVEA